MELHRNSLPVPAIHRKAGKAKEETGTQEQVVSTPDEADMAICEDNSVTPAPSVVEVEPQLSQI